MLNGKRILVMGLLDTRGLAWAIGSHATAQGAEVLYTVQNERFRDVLLRRSFQRDGLNVDDYRIFPCDVTKDPEISALFEQTGPLDGIVYSIAYAKPQVCMAETLCACPRSDMLDALEISAASLVYVARGAQRLLRPGASIVAMSFDSQHVYPYYNWMGVCKAALEGVARYLARDLASLGVRVNCISAGPQRTTATGRIPGFHYIADAWAKRAPAGWDQDEDRHAVADSTLFLLSDLSRRITGEVIYVDGGYHMMGLDLLPEQMPPQG